MILGYILYLFGLHIVIIIPYLLCVTLLHSFLLLFLMLVQQCRETWVLYF